VLYLKQCDRAYYQLHHLDRQKIGARALDSNNVIALFSPHVLPAERNQDNAGAPTTAQSEKDSKEEEVLYCSIQHFIGKNKIAWDVVPSAHSVAGFVSEPMIQWDKRLHTRLAKFQKATAEDSANGQTGQVGTPNDTSMPALW
jgi:hypothetical protein